MVLQALHLLVPGWSQPGFEQVSIVVINLFVLVTADVASYKARNSTKKKENREKKRTAGMPVLYTFKPKLFSRLTFCLVFYDYLISAVSNNETLDYIYNL